ncbi:hypothetical protein HanIR_Chr16g0811981 [Helianthus annuus]|nr:hypothetical protein HanIR_Chr16g0811981 [Helianthus annuus]
MKNIILRNEKKSNLNGICTKKNKFSSITTGLNTTNPRKRIISILKFIFHHLCDAHYFSKCNRMNSF